MTLSSSPGLEEFSDGIPPKKPDSTRRERILRIVIGILVVTTLAFATIQISQSELPGLVLGKGTITGSVLDSTGNPIRGEVFVIGTQNEVEIQPDGSFVLEGAPAGQMAVAVAQNGAAVEYRVSVEPGETVDMGLLEFVVVTPTP